MNNFYSLYSSIVDKISIMKVQELTDNIQITGEEARELTSMVQELDAKRAALKSKSKKETLFNKRMEINIEIKKTGTKEKRNCGVRKCKIIEKISLTMKNLFYMDKFQADVQYVMIN